MDQAKQVNQAGKGCLFLQWGDGRESQDHIGQLKYHYSIGVSYHSLSLSLELTFLCFPCRRDMMTIARHSFLTGLEVDPSILP